MATATTARATLPRGEHLRGCPVAANPDDAALAGRVETFRTLRPARLERRDGFEFPVPSAVVVVAHCCECGAMVYSEEGR